MKSFVVRIEGLTPLLHHRMTEDQLFGLLGAKSGKKKVKEEKTPRQIAEEHAYRTEDGKFYIPLGYISGAFSHVSGDYKQKNSARKSYKSIAGGVFRVTSEAAILVNPKTGKALKDFEVDVRRAVNHKAGAVAVCRPRFDNWGCEFTIEIDDSLLTPDLALDILRDAGKRSGIGSFRVSKGGFFGQFQVACFEPIEE